MIFSVITISFPLTTRTQPDCVETLDRLCQHLNCIELTSKTNMQSFVESLRKIINETFDNNEINEESKKVSYNAQLISLSYEFKKLDDINKAVFRKVITKRINFFERYATIVNFKKDSALSEEEKNRLTEALDSLHIKLGDNLSDKEKLKLIESAKQRVHLIFRHTFTAPNKLVMPKPKQKEVDESTTLQIPELKKKIVDKLNELITDEAVEEFRNNFSAADDTLKMKDELFYDPNIINTREKRKELKKKVIAKRNILLKTKVLRSLTTNEEAEWLRLKDILKELKAIDRPCPRFGFCGVCERCRMSQISPQRAIMLPPQRVTIIPQELLQMLVPFLHN